MSLAEARDRPFDPDVIEQASALASGYRIEVRKDGDGYAGSVAEFPSVFGYGSTESAASNQTRDLLKWVLAYLIETGRTPPGM